MNPGGEALFLCLLNKMILKLININYFRLTVLISVVLVSTIQNPANAQSVESIILRAAEEYGVSGELVFKVIKSESDFNPRAISSCDARGLMQLTRPTWNWICREYLKVHWQFDQDAFDAEKNIIVGTRFLRWISDYLQRNETELNDSRDKLVLACYNAGPGAVRNHGFRVPPFKETRDYVKKITAFADYN